MQVKRLCVNACLLVRICVGISRYECLCVCVCAWEIGACPATTYLLLIRYSMAKSSRNVRVDDGYGFR